MQRTHYLTIESILLLLFLGVQLHAQTPSDAIMMKGKQVCLLLDYNFSKFDHYWEGDFKRDNPTIGTVRRHSVMPMMAIGILDNLNVYAGVPHISTSSSNPNGGKFAGVSGFQDLTLAVKYRWLHKALRKGHLSSLATVGFATPISNYLSDYMPYSIGFGAPELSYRAIVQYEGNNRLYLRAAGAYVWKGYTEAERAYYYNDGSYFTPWMDVPSAITAELVLGKWLLNRALQVELSYGGQHSLSGDDIRAYNAPQPTNQVNMHRVGVFVHYYVPSVPGLGFIAYHNRVIHGRNAPEFKTVGVGATYFFNYRK